MDEREDIGCIVVIFILIGVIMMFQFDHIINLLQQIAENTG